MGSGLIYLLLSTYLFFPVAWVFFDYTSCFGVTYSFLPKCLGFTVTSLFWSFLRGGGSLFLMYFYICILGLFFLSVSFFSMCSTACFYLSKPSLKALELYLLSVDCTLFMVIESNFIDYIGFLYRSYSIG